MLADPSYLLILSQAAKELHDFELALALIENAIERYHDICMSVEYFVSEIELLHLLLNKTQEALKVLKKNN